MSYFDILRIISPVIEKLSDRNNRNIIQASEITRLEEITSYLQERYNVNVILM